MKLINAKRVNITEEFVDIDNIVDFEGVSYELYSKEGISREAFNKGFHLILQISEDHSKIIKLLS